MGNEAASFNPGRIRVAARFGLRNAKEAPSLFLVERKHWNAHRDQMAHETSEARQISMNDRCS